MAKTYYDSQYDQDSIIHSYSMGMSAPFDSRAVVDTTQDLYTKSTFKYAELYVGMVVVTLDTNDIYVLSVKPKATVSSSKWPDAIVWKKIGDVNFEPADYLSYYQEQLGAKILNSADGLVGITNPFTGQLAYVKDDPNTSEDESGLYIYTGQGWKKIFTGNSASSSGDISSVITTDGTIPESGTGFSITTNDPDAIVEEVYVDDYLHAGVYYTSKGINSSKDNGGSELEGVSSITLSNGGSSWIKLNHRGTIRINIEDDTLGFNLENIVGLIDDNGTEHQNPYADNPYSPSPIIISLADGCFLKFDKDIDFAGFTETRDDDPTEYVFGSTGSTFSDLDFYSVNVLPTVYAYANGEPVRVLTEGDKDELINMISEATNFTPITDTQIRNLF